MRGKKCSEQRNCGVFLEGSHKDVDVLIPEHLAKFYLKNPRKRAFGVRRPTAVPNAGDSQINLSYQLGRMDSLRNAKSIVLYCIVLEASRLSYMNKSRQNDQAKVGLFRSLAGPQCYTVPRDTSLLLPTITRVAIKKDNTLS